MAQSDAERQAATRRRKRERGLIEILLTIPKGDVAEFRRLALERVRLSQPKSTDS